MLIDEQIFDEKYMIWVTVGCIDKVSIRSLSCYGLTHAVLIVGRATSSHGGRVAYSSFYVSSHYALADVDVYIDRDSVA